MPTVKSFTVRGLAAVSRGIQKMSSGRVRPPLCPRLGVQQGTGSVRKAIVLGAALLTTMTATTRAELEDTNWMRNFGVRGVDNYILDMIEWNGDIVAAGLFECAGSSVVYGVALWDGSDWSPLGNGVNFDGLIGFGSTLAVYDGDLIVGGGFTNAGGVLCNNIARWDGTQWHALGSGTNGQVQSLLVFAGSLYVGGSFTTAGGLGCNYIARWNGASWSPLGSGMGPAGSSNVASMAVLNGSLYASGRFQTASGISVDNIARWNGASWSALGVGVNSNCFALASYGGFLVAGGQFTQAGGLPASHLARWNGAAWSPFPVPVDATVTGFDLVGSELAVMGDFQNAGALHSPRLAFWNGSAWSGTGAEFNGIPRAVVFQEDGVYIGGAFNEIDGNPIDYVTLYDGVQFHGVHREPAADLQGVGVAITSYGGETIVAGDFDEAGGVALKRIGSWNGTHWSPLGGGIDGDPKDVIVYDGELIVGGFFSTVDGGLPVNGIAAWDGSAWHALGTGTNGWVECLEVYGGDLYIGGSFSSVGGVAANNIARWDGTSWHAVGTGTDNKLESLGVHDGVLYAGGRFLNAGGVSAPYLAAWNGTSWSSVGGGVNSHVYALASHQDGLVVGGFFTTAGGNPASYIAMWDGSSWDTMGGGVDRGVDCATLHQGDLYVGGRFLTAGGVGARSLARWDGSHWSEVDGSMMGIPDGGDVIVRDVYDDGSSLWVAGNFIGAGVVASRGVAQWRDAVSEVSENVRVMNDALHLRIVERNPFGERTAVAFQLTDPEHARVEVIDAVGRRIRVLCDRELPAGEHRFEWDGRNGQESDAPAGIYFVRVSTPSASQAIRVNRVG